MSGVRDFADEYFDYRQSTEPHRLLYVGQVDHLEDWEDVTAGAIGERQAALRSFGDEAERRLGAAGPDDRVLLETMSFTARAAAHSLSWRTEQTMVNPAVGLHTMLFTFLGRFSLVTAEHGGAYLAKLGRLSGLLDQVVVELTNSAESGNVALSRHLASAADAIDGYLDGSHGAEDPLASQAAPTELSEREAATWSAEVDRIVATGIRPAMASYGAALRRLSVGGRSDDEAGFCHLEGGAELYRDLVWSSTTLDLSPEEIHRIGLDQVERIEAEYRLVAGPLLGTDQIVEIYSRLRDDPVMRYRSGGDIVRDATAALERAAEAAPDWFSTIPESQCIATEIPAGPLAFYSPPDPPTGKPGRFFFNTGDPAAWSTYQLEAVTFHESIPGHHLQLAGFRESKVLHPVQVHFGIMAYLEGWGLYTERLADEMGLYSSELARVGMLAADSMRACRLVVDTGMHALEWSRQQAVDYFLAHSPLSLLLIEGEIDRYIGMPAQALSYMLGRLEIDRIRQEAERQADFDIAAFHDKVLRHGMVPLPTLRRIVLHN